MATSGLSAAQKADSRYVTARALYVAGLTVVSMMATPAPLAADQRSLGPRPEPSLQWLRQLLDDLNDRGLVTGDPTRSDGVVTLLVNQATVNSLQGRDRNSGVVSRHLAHLRYLRVVCSTRPLQVDLSVLNQLDPLSTPTAPQRPLLHLAANTPPTQPRNAAQSPDHVGSPQAAAHETDQEGPSLVAGARVDHLAAVHAVACAITAAYQAGSPHVAEGLLNCLQLVVTHASATSHATPANSNPRELDSPSARIARIARKSRAVHERAGREVEMKNSLPPYLHKESDRAVRRAAARAAARADNMVPSSQSYDQALHQEAPEPGSPDREQVQVTCRRDGDLRQLLEPLDEMSRRCGVVGVTSLAGIELALRPYDDDQVRHAVALITRRLRVGDPIGSPFGLLTKKARDRDTAYFPQPAHERSLQCQSSGTDPHHAGDSVGSASGAVDDGESEVIAPSELASRIRLLSATVRAHTAADSTTR